MIWSKTIKVKGIISLVIYTIIWVRVLGFGTQQYVLSRNFLISPPVFNCLEIGSFLNLWSNLNPHIHQYYLGAFLPAPSWSLSSDPVPLFSSWRETFNSRTIRACQSHLSPCLPLSCDAVIECAWLLPVGDGKSLVWTSFWLSRALPVLGLGRPSSVPDLALELLVDVVRKAVRSSWWSDAATAPGRSDRPVGSHILLIKEFKTQDQVLDQPTTWPLSVIFMGLVQTSVMGDPPTWRNSEVRSGAEPLVSEDLGRLPL